MDCIVINQLTKKGLKKLKFNQEYEDADAPREASQIEWITKDCVLKMDAKRIKKEFVIASTSSWPEFEVKNMQRCVGFVCSKVPVASKRTCKKRVVAAVSYPKDMPKKLQTQVIKCAKEAAIAAAVVAVLGGARAASPVFSEYFNRCTSNALGDYSDKVDTDVYSDSKCGSWKPLY